MSDQLATPSSLIEQLRSWFHPKDRAVVVPNIVTAIPLLSGSTLAWCLVSETILTASAASVTFTKLSQNFRMLVSVVQARTDRALTLDSIHWQANGDTGNNYDINGVYGSNNLPASSATIATSSGMAGVCDAATSRAACFSGGLVFFPEYRSSTKEKMSFGFSGTVGTPTAATIYTMAHSSHWRNTAAISTLTFVPSTGPNFVAGSVFQLYGVL